MDTEANGHLFRGRGRSGKSWGMREMDFYTWGHGLGEFILKFGAMDLTLFGAICPIIDIGHFPSKKVCNLLLTTG